MSTQVITADELFVQDAPKGRIVKTCPVCGKIFSVPLCMERDYKTCGSSLCKSVSRKGVRNSKYRNPIEFGLEGIECDEQGYLRFYCKYCGKEFKRTPYKVHAQIEEGKGFPKFCSRRCTALARKTSSIIPCNFCGREVNKKASVLNGNHQKKFFCSYTCSNRSRAAPPLQLVCAFCGKQFTRQPSRAVSPSKMYKRSFCGLFCLRMWLNVEAQKSAVYTPDFFRLLFDVKNGVVCSYPNCGVKIHPFPDGKKRQPNPWGVCNYHANLIYGARRQRKERRIAMLVEYGESVLDQNFVVMMKKEVSNGVNS